MEAREYLERGWRVKKEIDLKQKQLAFWRRLATNASSNLSNVGEGEGYAKVETATVQALDLEREIEEERGKLAYIEGETLQYISAKQLEETDKALLQMRYVGYQSWRQIAKILGYAESHIWRKHSLILKRIANDRR